MTAKILIADDSCINRVFINDMLSGYDVLTANDGEEALFIIDDNLDIELIILDLNIQKIDGLEVLKVLKSNDKYNKIRTIILSDSDEQDKEIMGLRLGAVDYIRKPINFELMVDKIKNHLRIISIQQIENEFDLQNKIYEIIFKQAPIGIAISYNCYQIDLCDNNQAIINPIYEQITGRNKEEMLKLGWAKITHPEDLQENLCKYDELMKGNIKSYSMEKRFIKPDGSIVWVEMIVAKISLKNDIKYNHISLVKDITERKAIEKALHESERSKSVLLSNLPGMAYRCNYDSDWTMNFVSEGCYKLTGYKSGSLINNKDITFNDLIAPEYRKALWSEWEKILREKRPFEYEYEIITAEGQKKWILEMGQGIFDEQGNVVALEGIIIDISDRKEHENKLKYVNEHYELTGLYNHRFLDELLVKESIARKNDKRAILLIHLKKINSVSLAYGHSFSKKIIKELADKLSKIKNDNRILFQINFEKFAFYIRGYNSKCELTGFCNEIFSIIKQVHILNNMGCSVGVFEIEDNNLDPDSIIKNASVAAERADDKMTFEYCYYDEELDAKVNRENQIRDELFKIITDENDKCLYLQYQPILELRTGKIRGFEALVRFNCEKLGFVSPLEFIPIAEETQLIVPLGLKVIYMVCKFIKKLESAGYDNIRVSVNVSVIQLMREEFLGDLKELIKSAGIKTHNLGIEITESVFMDSFKIVNEKLCELKKSGIEISLDDFGTGYSSLSRVSKLNIDCLKIDKYFIDKILEVKPEEVVAGDIISMAHKQGQIVVAEGVEYEKQYQYLVDNNCDFIQGYFFSKPLDEGDALEILTDMIVIEKENIVENETEWDGKIYETAKFPFKMTNVKLGIDALIIDITKQKENEIRQQKELIRLKILTEVLSRHFENKQEQLDYVLHEALELTESQYGYIYFYDEERKEFTLNSWTIGVMEDCNVLEKLSKHQLDKTGLWGEAVRQRKPIIINDFNKSNPLKKGYPQGHVSLNKFMTIPVIIDDKIVAVVGLGNKKNDYDYNDVYQMTLLMNGVWNAVERREVQENIKYLSFHDSLTELYNKRFFDEELKRLDTERNLPISIIMGDVNGLKITNDVFGHSNGDLLLRKVAEVLKKVCRADDIISRSGGDEFLILLPNTNYDEAEKMIYRIKTELSKEKVKFIKCSMSMGACTKTDKNQSIVEIVEKAEEKMYYMKSTEKKELQKEAIDFMIKALHEKIEKEYEHSVNVSQLCEIMGKELKLSEKDIKNLKTAGYIHDLGKVALEPKYLDENYELSNQEKKDAKSHAILGYRLLNAIDSTNELAEAVLFHHERWDGSGYPKGLKGEEIPLNSRIISLAGHYDRFLSGRNGKMPLAKEEALNLIRSFSGTKFDPYLVDVFAKINK